MYLRRQSRTFTEWLALVNDQLQAIAGLSRDDLPDQNWWGWWDKGLTPTEAANEALDNEDFPG